MVDDDGLTDTAAIDDSPALRGVARFARMVRNVAWFATLGEPLSSAERDDAEDYVSALGFPDADVALVADWEEAEAAIRNPGWNSDWWEAEEQLRAGLIADAMEQIGEDELLVALTAVTSAASEVVHGAAAVAAARAGVADQALIRAAAGAATQGAYQAALVLAAGADDMHPFALKYRLFEAGHWPLGIVGSTFNLY
jgi:hypothetical protein